MAKTVKKKTSWLRYTSKVVGMNPRTFEERWSFKINRIQLLSILLLFIFIFIGISYVIFSYTPLSQLIPSTKAEKYRTQLLRQKEKSQYLQHQINLQSKFISNFQAVISGTIPLDSVYNIDTTAIDSLPPKVNFQLSSSNSKVLQQLNNNIQARKEEHKSSPLQLNNLFLFDPVKGKISQKFDQSNHPGVDIITPKKEEVKACLSGIVINASYSVEDGYTIVLLHHNNLSSVYKHLQSISIEPGKHVKIGETIGIVGNTGIRSSGPHLHFEFWSSNGPLNPLDYFSFGE